MTRPVKIAGDINNAADYPVPPADTLSTYLRRVTWEAAEIRFQPLHEKARALRDAASRLESDAASLGDAERTAAAGQLRDLLETARALLRRMGFA